MVLCLSLDSPRNRHYAKESSASRLWEGAKEGDVMQGMKGILQSQLPGDMIGAWYSEEILDVVQNVQPC